MKQKSEGDDNDDKDDNEEEKWRRLQTNAVR